jgi:hypothetical protein
VFGISFLTNFSVQLKTIKDNFPYVSQHWTNICLWNGLFRFVSFKKITIHTKLLVFASKQNFAKQQVLFRETQNLFHFVFAKYKTKLVFAGNPTQDSVSWTIFYFRVIFLNYNFCMFVKVLYRTHVWVIWVLEVVFFIFKKTIDHSQLQAEEGEGFRRGNL